MWLFACIGWTWGSLKSRTDKYPSFNAFFTRALKPEARPLTPEIEAIASPVDGSVSQAQAIKNGLLFQAKGQFYALKSCWAATGNGRSDLRTETLPQFISHPGLSPYSHAAYRPPDKMIHVPGRLFSVNNACARTIPRLFSRNERIVNLFETDAGPMAVIMVGAIFVPVWIRSGRVVSRRDLAASPIGATQAQHQNRSS